MSNDLETSRPHRSAPVVVIDGTIVAGEATVAFLPADSVSLLRSYLILVRSMRHQKRARDVVLRREDIEVLAVYLHEPEESILDRLAGLMGATRTQRTVMLSLFASGALVIGLSTSTAATSSVASTDSGTKVPPVAVTQVASDDLTIADTSVPTVVISPAPAVESAVVIAQLPQSSAPAPVLTSVIEPPAVAPPVVATSDPPVPAAAAPIGPSPRPAPVSAAPSSSSAPSDDPEPILVAVGEPPAPAPTDVAAEPIVDVGPPPVPTTTSIAPPIRPADPSAPGEPPLLDPPVTTTDTAIVAVGEPPVPPTSTDTSTPAFDAEQPPAAPRD